MNIVDHPSGLPEQEPTSPTAAVLCDGATWAKTGADWESAAHFCSWGALRNLAADRGGATLFDLADLADLPTGLTGLTDAQKEAVREANDWIVHKFPTACNLHQKFQRFFPEVLTDDRVSATWAFGDSDERRNELLRVARMEGAFIVAEKGGVKITGRVDHIRTPPDFIRIGYGEWEFRLADPGWTITVTAPKPEPEPNADIPDEVVEAAVEAATREWDSGRSVAYSDAMRLALAAADAKRAELEGGAK